MDDRHLHEHLMRIEHRLDQQTELLLAIAVRLMNVIGGAEPAEPLEKLAKAVDKAVAESQQLKQAIDAAPLPNTPKGS